MYKYLLSALLASAALSGCKQADKIVDTAKSVAGVAKSSSGSKASDAAVPATASGAPKAADSGFALPNFPAALVQADAKTYQTDIKFKPVKKQTAYFDKESKPAAKPSAGGYFRVVLGQTDDGRLVVQDFYQDSKAPQTAPFVMKKGGSIQDFSTDTIDGRSVWFDKDGTVTQIGDFQAGSPQGMLANYRAGKLVAQMNENVLVAYHPDGQNIAAVLQGRPDSQNAVITLYRTDGTAAAKFNTNGSEVTNMLAWDAAGKSVAPKETADEVKALSARMDEVLKYIRASH